MKGSESRATLGQLLLRSFPRRFKIVNRRAPLWEAQSNWSGAKRLFTFEANDEIVIAMELRIPRTAHARMETLWSGPSLLLLGTLTARLQPQGLAVAFLPKGGHAVGLMLTTRISKTRSTDLVARVSEMRRNARVVSVGLRTDSHTQAFLWAALEPRVGRMAAPHAISTDRAKLRSLEW